MKYFNAQMMSCYFASAKSDVFVAEHEIFGATSLMLHYLHCKRQVTVITMAYKYRREQS